MRVLADPRERADVLKTGRGVVLVDRFDRDAKSVLHAAHCEWARNVSPTTILRHCDDRESAVRWLRAKPRNRWKVCKTCGAAPVTKRQAAPSSTAAQAVVARPATAPHVSPEGTQARDEIRLGLERLLIDRCVAEPDAFRARLGFIEAYERLASAAAGIAPVLAASIELHPHQVRVARRVLSDPFQRYLLADEVGLGKTIEAAMVIRQRLADAPRSHIVIYCPASLVMQWEDELANRAAITDLRPRGLEVIAYDRDPRPFERHLTPDLVVIDEAHRVASGWADRRLKEHYLQAARLCFSTPRVLLLSATPMLHHERVLLAMLHLLDPDTFALDERAAAEFEHRMRSREALGAIFARLKSRLPAHLQVRALTELLEAIPNDDELAEFGREAQGRLAANDDASAALERVRVHVGETYRVHRRLLRTRRTDVEDTAYRLRGRSGLITITDEDPRRALAEAALTAIAGDLAAEAEGDHQREQIARDVFAALLGRLSGPLAGLASLARAGARRPGATDVTEDERDALSQLWRSEALERWFERLLAQLGDEPEADAEYIDALLAAVDERPGKAVMFCSSTLGAQAVAERARLRGGTDVVALIVQTQAPDAQRAELRSFQQSDGPDLIVCDRIGEEGLNLQIAENVVHVDLPTSTTRVEQRTGRLDRRSDGEPVNSIALAPLPGGYLEAWLRTLQRGFGVFERSSAPLQYAVETVEQHVLWRMLFEGPDAVAGSARDIADDVAEEQERIARVDGLDVLAGDIADDEDLMETYEAAESHAGALLVAAEEYVRSAGARLGIASVHPPEGADAGFDVSGVGAVADRDFAGLAANGVAVAVSRAAVVEDDQPLDHAATRIRLARPGSAGMDLINRLARHDAETSCCAVWHTPPVEDDTLVGICCEVLVRADVTGALAVWRAHERAQSQRPRALRSDADAPLDREALQRRADKHLAPQIVRIWLDPAGRPIADADNCERLNQALGTAPGQVWSDHDWRRAEILAGVETFGTVATRLAEAALAAGLEEASAEVAARAAARQSEEGRLELARLRVRAARAPDGTTVARRELEAAENMLAAMVAALRSPAAEILGVALVVITNQSLTGTSR